MMRRKGVEEMARGSVKQDKRVKNGVRSWVVTVDIGPDPTTGKRRQRRRSFPTRKVAEAEMAAWRAEIERGEGIDTGRSPVTVSDLLRRWLTDHMAPKVRPRTLYLYRDTCTRHIEPYIGRIEIRALTPARVQAYYARARADGLSERSLSEAHKRLSQALDVAMREGVVARNVCALVTTPTYRPPERTIWDAAQARRFLSVARESSYGPIWILAMGAGLRRGELLGLRWADVDLHAGTMRIVQSTTRLPFDAGGDRDGLTTGATKTKKGKREIALHPTVLAALRAHRAASVKRRLAAGVEWPDHDLVFTTSAGIRLDPGNLRHEYDRLVEKAAVPHITAHDHRHSFTTLAIDAGVPIKAVSEALGHADVAITLRTYAHVGDSQRARAFTTVGDLLFAPEDMPADDTATFLNPPREAP